MLSFLYAICRKAVPALVAVPAFLFVISCQTVTGPVREVRSDKQPSAQELYEKADHNLQAGLSVKSGLMIIRKILKRETSVSFWEKIIGQQGTVPRPFRGF